MKTKTAILNGKLDVGTSCARFDEGEVASAKPRRESLLYKCNTLKFYLSVIFVCASFVLAASPVEKDDAIRAVSSWLRLRPQKICQIGTEVLDSQTYATTNGATFHVVNLKDGGFVVTSADTDIEPIIAFSASGNFKKDEKSPLWTLLCKDLAGRSKALGLNVQTRKMKLAGSTANSAATTVDTPSAKWARLIGRESPIVSNSIRIGKLSATSTGSGDAYDEDVRVPPLLKTQWNQNGNFTFLGQPLLCYNLYTPHNYPCGCVATAGAQVMYYHRYPEKDIWWPVTRRCYVDGAPIDYKMQGGSYSWDDMPCKPVDGMTAPVQCEAIGKLTSDVGIACGTAYTHDVSTSFVCKLAQVLTDVFDYENAIPVIGGDAETVRKALISNLNAKLPVILGLSNGPGIGHAIVADGYGYSGGTFYVHCNMGYGGKDDAWYAQQNIDGMVIDKMVCNVYPQGAPNGVICSGRVMLSVDGAEPHPLYNVTVDVLDAETGRMTGRYTETDHNGIYSMILPSGSYTIRARYNEDELLQSVDLSSNVATRIDYDTGTYYSFPVASINNRHDVDFKFDIQSVPVEAFYSHYYYYADMVDCFVLEVIKDQDVAPRGSYTIPASYEGHSVGGLWYGSYGPGLTSVTIPDSVKGLSGTFSYCSGLLSADIPNSVRVFSGVFYNCIRLESVAIPSAVKEIGDHCFYGCCSLKSATIPNGVTNICSYAFQNCSSLTSIIIPNSVESIGWDAFSGCSGLTSVTIPDSVSLMGPGVFANCNGLTNVNLSSSLTEIPDGAFSHCGNLQFVKIPGNVKVIDYGAFDCCKNLTTVEIDDGVTEIGSLAFAGCSCLTAISIPPSVNVIRSLAFMLCKSLSVVFVAPGDTERVKELLSNGGVDKLQFVEGRVLETCMVTYKPGVNGVGPERTVTKLNGIVLTLEGAIFTRSGYTQTGWSLTDGGAKAYDLNGAYATDAEIVLYPYWVANSTEPVQTFAEALGVPELECEPWGSTKDRQLRIDPDWTCDGNGAATVGNNLSEWTATPGFSFKVTGPTQMRFSYSKSFSLATFSVDCTAGTLYRDDAPGEKTEWKQVVLDIPAGEQIVTFKVRLGDAAPEFNTEYDYNGFWIDDLQFGEFEHEKICLIDYDLGPGSEYLSAAEHRPQSNPLTYTASDLPIALADARPLRSGTVFAGWTMNGKAVTEIPKGTTGNVTLVAVWKNLYTVTFDLGKYGVRKGGGELSQTVMDGEAATAPEFVVVDGWTFAGWNASFDRVTSDLTVTANWKRKRTEGLVEFAEPHALVEEGGMIRIEVWGGNAEKSSSVSVYLTYQTAAAADIDFQTATVDGVTPKGGLKFPLSLSWSAGDTKPKTIMIPVKTDNAVEDDETLVFQLAAAQGVELGDQFECAVKLADANEAATLQDGAMNPSVKLTSKATADSPAWRVGLGNASNVDGSFGLYHAESPALSVGKSAELSIGALKTGTLYFYMRFSGPIAEEVPSTLTIYNGKLPVGVIGHGDGLRQGWALSVSNVWSGAWLKFDEKGIAPRFVFTQGSNPDVHIELSNFYFDEGKGAMQHLVFALSSDVSGGYVTGSGHYVAGTTAKLKATARPGWTFKHWVVGVGDGTLTVWSQKASVSWKVTSDLEVLAVFERIPYVAGLADPADGGKVTGSGYCASGKKVTLKAKASKNFTFVGWCDDKGVVATQPTLVVDRSAKPAKPSKTQDVITNVNESVAYYARFVSDPEVFVTVASTDGNGDALTGKGAGKYVAGSISGAGKYAPDKKVTLKATANKGYVFSGWYDGDILVSRLVSYVLTMPTNDVQMVAKFVTAKEDAVSIAASVNGMALSGTSGETPLPLCETNVMTGVYLEWPVAADALSLPTVKVAGLPSGLKFAAKDIYKKGSKTEVEIPANTIYGTPTKASAVDKYGDVKPSTVKVTVTTAGKSKADYVISRTVDPIPGFAVGTFDGWYGDGVDVLGSATLTVAANGKVTGKVLMPMDGKGKTYNFKADSLSGFSRADDGSVTNVAIATTLTSENKAAVPLALTFAPDEIGIGCVEGMFDSPWSGGLWLGQNGWKRGGYVFPYIPKDIVKTLDDGLTLSFKKNGVVTIGGKIVGGDGATLVSVKGSAQLVSDPESEDGFLLLVYVPPAKNLASGLCRLYDVKLIDDAGDNVVTDVQLIERIPNSGE